MIADVKTKKHRKIRVNAISPGMIDTPGLNGLAQSQEQLEQFKTSFVSTIPLGRMGSPDEVAKAVLCRCLRRA
jgi:NAD(P)-dependent dehydrogenase (short-subunit alcohol dehydrogenase family)